MVLILDDFRKLFDLQTTPARMVSSLLPSHAKNWWKNLTSGERICPAAMLETKSDYRSWLMAIWSPLSSANQLSSWMVRHWIYPQAAVEERDAWESCACCQLWIGWFKIQTEFFIIHDGERFKVLCHETTQQTRAVSWWQVKLGKEWCLKVYHSLPWFPYS